MGPSGSRHGSCYPRYVKRLHFKKTSYWLSGTEECAHCMQRYVYEAEYRCHACDGAICCHCVVVLRETSEVVCPDCHAQPAEE